MVAKSSTVKTSSAQPTLEEIAKRSYELFLDGGGEHGHHEEHWLQAERELSRRSDGSGTTRAADHAAPVERLA